MLHLYVSLRCDLISLQTVDLSLPIVSAIAVLVEPLVIVIPVRIIRLSSSVKCENEFKDVIVVPTFPVAVLSELYY